MEIVWPTRSRTGSQFVLLLTTSLCGPNKLMPQARITGSRTDTYRTEEKIGNFSLNAGMAYLEKNNIKSMKYEDPGKDDFILEVAARWPNSKFICSYRPLPLVITSHYNIKTWGHEESDIIYQFSSCITLYEELHKQNRLMMVDVTDKSAFSLPKAAAFLGADINAKAQEIVAAWSPINTLDDQVSRYGGNASGIEPPPRIDRLFDIHPWAVDVEEKYRQLCRETSQ